MSCRRIHRRDANSHNITACGDVAALTGFQPFRRRSLAKAAPGDRLHRVYLLISLAAAETQLKHYGPAESSLQRATALANSELPPGDPARAVILVHLAAAQEAQHLHSLAEQSLRRAAALQAEHLGLESPELARTLHKYALVLEKLGRKDEAQSLEYQARTILAREKEHELKISSEQLKRESK